MIKTVSVDNTMRQAFQKAVGVKFITMADTPLYVAVNKYLAAGVGRRRQRLWTKLKKVTA